MTKIHKIESTSLPLTGIRVIEFCHMVMGPTCGMILGDLGADVIKVEPLKGDTTRRLKRQGAGFFATYNRNKRSISVDLSSDEGKKIARRLIATADVLIENLRPGGMAHLGFGYDQLKFDFPGLIYCSLKGFLPGPYEHRKALDEVVQMMGGLAYMTGPTGRPLRAGASVIDIMGGMYGVIGIQAALRERERTGLGQKVSAALFETTVHAVAQHMAQFSVTKEEPLPMPDGFRAWSVYDIFDTADCNQLFIGVVSDTQWKIFCEAFDKPKLMNNPAYETNAERYHLRPEFLPELKELFSTYSKADLMEKCDRIGLPFAPITKPHELYDDPHLKASKAILSLNLPTGGKVGVPSLPLIMGGRRLGARLDLPGAGEHGPELIRELGISETEIEHLISSGILKVNDAPS
jgi:crotonobetainyl-CoA:carnitine CoA-transferase CaiB-like acyl-CoA transferase